MPILDNNQVILSYNGGGVSPLNVSISPSSITGNQNSTIFTFTEGGSDIGSVSRRFYVFDNESDSTSQNPSYTFTNPGNKKVSVYFYSDSLGKVGYAEANLTIYQPSGYTADLISNCDICGALTRESLSYTGPLVRLFRESDWQVSDIPYDSFETLDVTSATTFLNLSVDDTLSGLPLDIMSPVKSLGYSVVRKLRTDYSGSAFRVRRSSDNVEQDIGFDVNGYVQLSAVTDFLSGSTTGFCTTIYNQGTLGVNGDWIQTNASTQPLIDTTTFSYPSIDISNRIVGTATTQVTMVNRSTPTVGTNYSTTTKLNTFLTLKAKSTQSGTSPLPIRLGSGSIGINPSTNTSNINGTTYSVINSSVDFKDWTLFTNRLRLDYTNDRRYVSLSVNNYESQSSTSSSELTQPYTINLYKTVDPLNLNGIGLCYGGNLIYTYTGWFTEFIIDDTDLSLNQFYKIKKFMADFQSIPYSASTNTGLRVNRIYNQKQSSTNGNHYIQNCVSNMPEFRINDPIFNRPSIYSVNTDIGSVKVGNERRVSSITYNGSNVTYDNIYSFVNLYTPSTGYTSSNMSKSSSNSVISYYYHNNPPSGSGNIQLFNNSVTSMLNISNPNPSRLKINSYRQVVPSGLRIMTIGTGSTSASTVVTNGTISTSRSHLFHLYNSSTNPYIGGMFFDMSFSNIPSTTDWNNLIYPLLKNKYGAVDI